MNCKVKQCCAALWLRGSLPSMIPLSWRSRAAERANRIMLGSQT